ncbi:MAG: hypothetical protein RLZZ237_797 [Pseudomonadota bacterium]
MQVRRLFFLPVFALVVSFASAAYLPGIRIGVLAYKGADAVPQDWSYVTRHLQASIPGVRFVLAEAGFRCVSSSRLYPDWPFFTLRQTPPALAKQVAREHEVAC